MTASNDNVRLFLVRHGQTEDNIHMRYIGSRDEPLTGKGVLQAQQVADALSQLNIKIVVSSPLSRAADTAARIQTACGVELRLEPRLAEGSFGDWEGLTRSAVLRLGGRDAEALARWESNASSAPPGGESFKSVQNRAVEAAEALRAEFAGSSVVLVSHVGPIKALLAHALDLPLQTSRALFLDPATISVVEWGTQPLLRLFNSHAHLGWSSARWMI
jgi:broad specificity phosphatase PhoE